MSAHLVLTHKRLGSPALLLLQGYLALALAGSLLLLLPAAQITPLGWLDTLFTAVSAVTVTGLVVVDTGSDYSVLGQTIIGLLIQLGGLGYMTLGAAAMLSFNASVGLRNQAMLSSFWQLGPDLRLSDVLRFSLLFSLGVESVLTALFALHWVPLLGWPQGLGTSLFHAVSAFNNAGFALFNDSLMSVSPGWMVLAHAAGFIIGGLGFAVMFELLVLRRCRSLHTRLVLWATLTLLAAGTLLLLLFEHDHSLAGLGWRERLLHAFFQNATARTAGFNSLDIAEMSPAGQSWLMLNMVIGAGPGSTAGGIRITTFVLLITGVVAALQGRTETRMLGRMLGVEFMLRAAGILVITLILLLLVTLLAFYLMPGADPFAMIFELISALGTVGLSMGMTGELNPGGKVLIMAVMMIGKLSPVYLFTALAGNPDRPLRYAGGRIALG